MNLLLFLPGGCFRRVLLIHWSQQLWVTHDHLWALAPKRRQQWGTHSCNAEAAHLLHLVDRNEPGAESLEGKRVRISWGQPLPPPQREAGAWPMLRMCW